MLSLIGLVALSLPSWRDVPEQGSGSVFLWLGVTNEGCPIPPGIPAGPAGVTIQSKTPRFRSLKLFKGLKLVWIGLAEGSHRL